MITDLLVKSILEQQILLGRPLCLEEVVDLFEESRHEVWTALEQMNDEGYLFFDGDIVEVYR